MREIEIQQAILRALGARPDCRIWRTNVGAARLGTRLVKFGFAGLPDILGILRGGRFLAIEVKTPNGRQSPPQAAFQRMVESLGGLYVLARSVEDAVGAVNQALGVQ